MGEVNPMTSNPSDTTNSGQTLGMIVSSHPLRRAGRLPLPYKPYANTSVLQKAAPLQGAAQQPWQRDPYPPKKEQYVGPDRRRKPTGGVAALNPRLIRAGRPRSSLGFLK